MLELYNKGVMCSNCNMDMSWIPSTSAPVYNLIVENQNYTSNSNREMRNKAEKMRRDKLNSFIGELATLVPLVSRSAKRMDKTSILRLTATHLRINQTLLNGKNNSGQHFPNIDQFVLEQLVYEQLSGFLIILTNTGKIVFVSQPVEQLLGHLQTDLMGQSIYSITAPEDQERLRMHISSDEIFGNEWRKYFTLHIRRAGLRSEAAVYESVSFVGVPKINNSTLCNGSSSKEVSTVSSFTNDILIFFAKLLRPEPITDLLIEAAKDEYLTRHLVDGRIITCDQRISYVAGYMTEEVSGLSAFKFMHRDDVRWVMIALRQMYDRGDSRGSSCYRLLSRTGQFIYLRTAGFLEIDNTGTVESFVCINTLVSEQEGERLIKEMKARYSALIKAVTPIHLTGGNSKTSLQAVEDPQQLELAIAHLITNLPSPASDSCSTHSSHSAFEIQDCQNTTERHSYSPNPPLTIRVKSVSKRPPSTDLEVNVQKRHRGVSNHNHTNLQLSPPYQSVEKIVHKENDRYREDQLLNQRM